MFFKYLSGNIKKSVCRYILLIICIIAVIVVSTIANVLYINSTAQNNNIAYNARSYSLQFRDKAIELNAAEVRDKLYEMIERAGLECTQMMMSPAAPADMCEGTDPTTNIDYKASNYIAENYGSTWFWWFSDYGDMADYFADVWGCDKDVLPTEEQFNNNKVIILGARGEYTTPTDTPGRTERTDVEYTYSDENHVIIGGEEFLVTGKTNMPWSTAFFNSIPQNMITRSIQVEFRNPLTLAQVQNVDAILEELFGDLHIEVNAPKTTDLLDLRKSRANIILTVMMQIICVFNILIIYKFIVDSRKKQFAVMRLCGFSKLRCVSYLWGEIALLTAVCLPAAFGIFELLKPVLTKKYITVPVLFTPAYYVRLGGIFIGVITVVFSVYILPSFGKNVSRELREM